MRPIASLALKPNMACAALLKVSMVPVSSMLPMPSKGMKFGVWTFTLTGVALVLLDPVV
nr:hypothetical protein [Paracidovorax cattleyae]